MTKLLDRRRAAASTSATEMTIDPVNETQPGFVGPPTDSGGDNSRLDRFDGRSRRRQAALVVSVAALTGVAGIAVGSQVRSPADEAALRAAPTASRITVPVTREQLESNLTLSAEVQYSEPFAVTVAGPVGTAADEAQVVTLVPEAGTPLVEGDAPFEVSGRPVIFLQGALPMYRGLAIGSEGPDVDELETALDRLGYDTGTVDAVFDQSTADALTALYATLGHAPEMATADQAEALRLARDAVATTDQALRDAITALTEGSSGPRPSELLQLRQNLDAAKAAVPVNQQTAANDNSAAQNEVSVATAALNTATAARDQAANMRVAANLPDAIDADTGEPFTATRRAELNAAATQTEQDLVSAQSAVTAATNAVPVVTANGDASVRGATDAVALAQVQLDEATKPADTTGLQQNVDAARKAVDQAGLDLVAAEAAAGPRVSPGEFVFVPVLPSVITEVYATLGSPAAQQLAMISTADTALRASISRVDADLVQLGDTVTIEIRDLSVEVPGSVVFVGAPPAEQPAGAGDDGSGGQPVADASASSGRLQVAVAPDDPTALLDYVGRSAKIRISIASTDSDVLVVPVSALTVGPDGNSRIEIERTAVTDDDIGDTVQMSVEVGLSAGGLVEIRPIDATLIEGDRVVIGTQTQPASDAEAAGDVVAD